MYMAVTDRRAHKRDVALLQCQFQTEITHHRPNHTTLKQPLVLPIRGENVKQLVSIDDFTPGIHHDHTVTIAVQGDTQIRTMLKYRLADKLRIGRSTLLIDIQAIRINAHCNYVGPEFLKYGGSHLVCRTIGTINNNFKTAQRDFEGYGAFAKLNITTGSIINTGGFPHFF